MSIIAPCHVIYKMQRYVTKVIFCHARIAIARNHPATSYPHPLPLKDTLLRGVPRHSPARSARFNLTPGVPVWTARSLRCPVSTAKLPRHISHDPPCYSRAGTLEIRSHEPTTLAPSRSHFAIGLGSHSRARTPPKPPDHSPVILQHIMRRQTLQEPFIVRDHDQLEVGLSPPLADDPARASAGVGSRRVSACFVSGRDAFVSEQ